VVEVVEQAAQEAVVFTEAAVAAVVELELAIIFKPRVYLRLFK
jgi:hypothetical protein